METLLEKFNLLKREKCPECGRSGFIFCDDCLGVILPNAVEIVPKINLPIHVAVIHHHDQKLSSSTGLHAAVLAPDNVTFYNDGRDAKEIPEFDAETTFLLYPSKSAKTLKEYKDDGLDLSTMKTLIV